MIPRTGFFPRYVKYASELTDAPELYHVAAALAVHSAVCSNLVEIYYPTFIVDGKHVAGSLDDPNFVSNTMKFMWSPSHLWSLIVGSSGESRKSTAINLATEMAKPLIEEQMAGEISSPESTFDWVSNHPDSFFVYGEGAALFSLFNASYWQHGQGLFPRLYDGVDMKKQLTGIRDKKKDPVPKTFDIEIHRPRVSLLVGVATSHLDAARSTDWTGGLIGRMTLVYAERDRLDPIPGKTNLPEMLAIRAMLEEEKKFLLKNQDGIMRIGMKADAGLRYMQWTTQIDLLQKRKGAKVRALYNRLPNHVMRIAAHYALSQGYKTITIDTIDAAINFGNASVVSIDRVAEMLTDDKIVRSVVRLRDYLRSCPQQVIPYRQLITDLHMSEFALRLPVQTLKAAGEVRLVETASTREQWLIKQNPSKSMPQH